jgi:hypothetical protein
VVTTLRIFTLTEDRLLRTLAFFTSRIVLFASLAGIVAGCSGSGMPGATNAATGVNANRQVANGLAQRTSLRSAARSGGWISPDGKKSKNLIYWGNYDSSTITIYSGKGVNGKEVGQITSGLSNPERLFVDSHGSVYATNIGTGNGTVTGYKAGQTTPFITISNGVNRPTGLTVDAAGTIYCANVGNDTITVYPKGQTSPSLTINYFAEYLATDAHDNLYASGTAVEEFAPGSATGTNLGLPAYPGALEVDKKGNLIVLYGSTVEYFPAGQTSPSKEISVSGSPFALSLSKNNKELAVSTEVATPFVIQTVAYPNGTSFSDKLSNNGGDWPFALSPDNALGS